MAKRCFSKSSRQIQQSLLPFVATTGYCRNKTERKETRLMVSYRKSPYLCNRNQDQIINNNNPENENRKICTMDAYNHPRHLQQQRIY